MSDHLLAMLSRRARDNGSGNAISDLLGGAEEADVRERRGYPRAAMEGVATFYDQLDQGTARVCEGTACWSRGGDRLRLHLPDAGTVRCLGRCHEAPVAHDPARVLRPAPIPRSALGCDPVVLRNLLGGIHAEASEYDLPDGDEILALLEASGLRGRGGAAYPTGRKWRAARDAVGDHSTGGNKYIVCNGDEGDPGSYVDRLLLEEDPHAVLAGMVAAARAVGADRGVVYIRAEYPHARAITLGAIAEARAQGHLGPTVGFDVEVHVGGGSYVCGEETALLRSIEGLRGEPWPKPPYPAERGLWGCPTVVQNVETLAVVPWVVRSGRVAGTKAVCLSGAIAHPGVVEVPLGMPVRQILDEGGGGPPPGTRWRMALIGGPMGRVLDAAELDTGLSYDALPGMGHGGIVMLDDSVTPAALAGHLAGFAAAESCGNCTPCRVGTGQLLNRPNLAALERLLETMRVGSLCGFGQGVPTPFRDLIRLYGAEVLR